ncbi:MAG: nitrophenyl compound nitroreductase subunit ArsF family protein [Saprospiraceae bacterium]
MKKSILTIAFTACFGMQFIPASVQADMDASNKAGSVFLIVSNAGNTDEAKELTLAKESQSIYSKSSLIKRANADKANDEQVIQVIQFHNEHRCATCLKIEELTKKTLADYFPDIPFSLVNVEDKKNKKMTEQFEAFGTSLFLYNPTTGRKKDLTDFAFMNAGDEKKFEAGLKKHIEDFLKS